jgi:iron-sulfur cluster assembly protein
MITVTESAAKKAQQILAKEGHAAGTSLRLAVQGGGCNGFSYKMSFEAQPRPTDARFDSYGLQVLVDPKSQEFLSEITLDYVDGLNSGFQWRNPRATKTCSCGESFDMQREAQ